MPVLKIKKNGVWEHVSGISEHTHLKDDIIGLKDPIYKDNEAPANPQEGDLWLDMDEEAVVSGGSGVLSWNNLTDKPFEGKPIDPNFNNDLTDRIVIPVDDGINLVKITNNILTEKECVDATMTIISNEQSNTEVISKNGIIDVSSQFGIPCFMVTPDAYVNNAIPFVAVVKEPGVVMGMDVSAGTYYLSENNTPMYTSYFSALDGAEEVIKKLDFKYLPGFSLKTTVKDSNITFNGDINSVQEKVIIDSSNTDLLYALKLSSNYIPVERLIGGEMVISVPLLETESTISLTSENVFNGYDAGLTDNPNSSVVNYEEMPAIFSSDKNIYLDDTTYLSPGTWFLYIISEEKTVLYTKSVSYLPATETSYKLDSKFIDAEWMAKSETKEALVEFNGDPTGYEITSLFGAIDYIKVSNTVLTVEQLLGSTLIGRAEGEELSIEITSDILSEGDPITAVAPDGSSIPFIFICKEDFSEEGLNLTVGTWFLHVDASDTYIKSVSCLKETKEIYEKIPKKFLPDMLPEVDSSSNGAFLRVIDGAWAIDKLANVEDGEY